MQQTQKDAPDASLEAHDEPGRYEIRLQGHLEQRWTHWFEGMTITQADGDTLLSGVVVDQAALHGLLRKVRDLNLPLIAVTRIDPIPTTEPDVNTTPDNSRS